ncbi:hypothetical protein Pcinc_030225 [Petrolisthes cinctipes]|uniref:Uncharacterized protein n=1 Tax=Petrolisthes cinctipes TaxID=88211 RepID=A0AAE1EYT7_PETCI|nr:hypothetical protein Pcinc_030225 [Petrolisthes cinctipes]
MRRPIHRLRHRVHLRLHHLPHSISSLPVHHLVLDNTTRAAPRNTVQLVQDSVLLVHMVQLVQDSVLLVHMVQLVQGSVLLVHMAQLVQLALLGSVLELTAPLVHMVQLVLQGSELGLTVQLDKVLPVQDSVLLGSVLELTDQLVLLDLELGQEPVLLVHMAQLVHTVQLVPQGSVLQAKVQQGSVQ